ncbi:hypothetical protein E5288_WYG009887 [Bos mutus]|uniref:Uncharacterized protein n=1 Tax=Bos mutus TaxID=72004 RepID=A0A6B0RW18_9CETA|nr:hypothetical protein [Bos mutus]
MEDTRFLFFLHMERCSSLTGGKRNGNDLETGELGPAVSLWSPHHTQSRDTLAPLKEVIYHVCNKTDCGTVMRGTHPEAGLLSDRTARENQRMVNAVSMAQSYADIRRKLQKLEGFTGMNIFTNKMFVNPDREAPKMGDKRMKQRGTPRLLLDSNSEISSIFRHSNDSYDCLPFDVMGVPVSLLTILYGTEDQAMHIRMS